MKNFMLAVLLLLCGSLSWAVLSTYSFQQTTSPWTEITTPTVIHAAGIDDAMSPVINIGFSFYYDELTYTQFKANSNGFITLNPASTASLSNLLTTTPLIIGALWDDLKTGDVTGNVSYELSGTSPNQVLTVQYKEMKWYYSTTNLVNFQIKLYQGTNKIEFIYGAFGTVPGTSASASIGLSGAVAGNYLSVTPASPTATVSSTTEMNTINDTYISFLTGNKYTFTPPIPPVNDLAATAISGNSTPSVGTATTYTVSVYNRGSNAQSTYSVQLIDATNTVLASVAGTAIASGATLQVPVVWTPAAEGPVALRGKVVMTGDEYAPNDVTTAINVTVMAAGVIVVTIGDGSQTARMPIDFFYHNSLNETLYFPTEIGMFGNVTAISLYNQFTQDLPNQPVKIWMGSTDQSDLSAGWIPSTSLTQVFDGTVSFATGENVITIGLQVPYAYSGGNLVILFNRPMDTVYYNSTDYFKAQTIGTNRARNVYSDSIVYDPANPGAVGTVTGQFAKTSLHMTPLSPDPLFAITPSSKNFGSVLMNTTNNQVFTIINAGGGTLNVSNISIAGSPFFTLQNMPTLPANLTTGQTITFTARYNPTAAGAHTATISITDNRMVHTVALSGTSVDVTIYSLPYAQNFDAVTVPALPIDWTPLISPAGTTSVIATYATTPYSAPNCVRLYNGATAGTNVMLIAPPLDTPIQTNTVRLRLMVKGGATTYTLSIGVMTNPQDAATYTEVQNFATPTTWTEFSVPFNGYTGTGKYIVIKHGGAATGQTIYVDNATIELIAANDLACTALTGNSIPSLNSATTYTASIFNWGFNSQSTYSVKLYNAANTELATAAGVTCAPGATVQVPLVWTPTAEGPVVLHAKVILAGDQNSANDQSPNLNVTVLPAGLIAMTVGDGSQTMRIPLDFYYHNSLYETLYYPTEIGMYGNILTLTLYNQFVTTTLANMPTKIWMGTTTLADLSAGYIPSTSLTQVFDGTVAYPGGANTINIPLQTAFNYTSGNLVILFNRPMDTVYYSSSDFFYGQTVGTNRARNIYSDSTVYDPANPGAVGTVTGQFPKTTFTMTPLGTDPIFNINPASKDFGTCLINTTHNQTFTMMNMGAGTLAISAITISGSPFFSLQNVPTLPVNLSTGQTATFIGRYNPTAVGTHTATITITDNRGNRYEYNLGDRDDRNRLLHTVALSGNCIDTTVNALPYTQLFDGVTAPALPVDWSSLITPASTTAAVVTYATGAFSEPNCVRMYNGSTTLTAEMLIAPPLSATLPMNGTRLRVKVKGTAATYTVSIGVMTDPMDASTFTEVANYPTPTAWMEYAVSFAAYTGTGRYIAIKHGNGGTGQTIYIDNAVLEQIAPNDLGASYINGNVTPTAGAPSNYNIGILNWGTNPQSTYTVKIFDSNNVELASAPGVTVAPGASVEVTVPWTPAAAGSISIYGKVVLTGDANSANDQTTPMTVLVNPSGVFTITVGDGSQTARIPMDFFWKNSLFETLYYPAELSGFIGQITGIQFYSNFITNLPNGATKVWIGTTTQADLSGGWIPSTQLTLVYDGNVQYPSGPNIITIPFNSPYLYLNSENIVMMVDRPMDTVYYSSSDNFYCQTVGTNRARYVYSDTTTYDPAAPGVVGTVSGQFPKTTFFVIPGGVGHINGTVLGVGNLPLSGVAVHILTSTYSTTTDAAGHYVIHNILPNTYTIEFSVYGYITATQTFTLDEDETETINITMQPMPMVNVTGTVVASDTMVGISGAEIHLEGYADYDVNTIATGAFTVPGVYANHPYAYTIMAPGYTAVTGNINVTGVTYDMGTIILNEIAYAPHNVVAAINTTGMAADLTWQAPDPNATEITESFEAEGFPPQNWTQIVNNNGPSNTSGVFPTWCRFGAITISGQPATPTDGSYQSGIWWVTTHQDEWLITPSFNCPPQAYLNFDSWVFLGSTNADHYYVKISTNNGSSWTPIWDASAQTGGWNYYASPINVDLSLYSGQQIKLAFNATDGPADDGLWYVWFIDDIYIGNALTALDSPVVNINFSSSDLISKSAVPTGFQHSPIADTNPSRRMEMGGTRTEPRLPFAHEVRYSSNDQRPLQGYKVWRLSVGQESNESSWSLITPTALDLTVHSLSDAGWQTLPNGDYRWAVKGLYSNGVNSVASFSNVLNKVLQSGQIAGVVRRPNTVPIQGAVVSAMGFSATTNTAGAYTLVLPIGTYDVTCTATGYTPQTAQGIVVNLNQTTTLNYIMAVGVEDDVIPVTETTLIGNYPNPFNPETTLSYSIKEASPVKLEIFNAKGQLVRTLVNQTQPSGWYNVVWNGKDDNGQAVSSGVYMYRLSARSFRGSRKMILMQ